MALDLGGQGLVLRPAPGQGLRRRIALILELAVVLVALQGQAPFGDGRLHTTLFSVSAIQLADGRSAGFREG